MAESLQTGLALGFLSLLVVALIAGAKRRHVRPTAFAAGVVAGSHALYYVLFVWFPDVLDAAETMLFSIVLRYEVLGLVAIILALSVLRGRWPD
jgi:hypothetical protein